MNLIICRTESGDRVYAQRLAEHLGVELTETAAAPEERDGRNPRTGEGGDVPLELLVDGDGLSLICGRTVLRGDFRHMLSRLKYHNLTHEMLVRAAGPKARESGKAGIAIDATAGLGEDSLLLAAAGYDVYLYEHNPVTAALLEDALRRADSDPELSATASRMHFQEGSSIEEMHRWRELLMRHEEDKIPDLIFLDPMFPERQKHSQVKKKLQMLQQLEIPCPDEEELLDAALSLHPGKVVIKRPLKGPFLAGRKPSYCITGKIIRYDCIVL